MFENIYLISFYVKPLEMKYLFISIFFWVTESMCKKYAKFQVVKCIYTSGSSSSALTWAIWNPGASVSLTESAE